MFVISGDKRLNEGSTCDLNTPCTNIGVVVSFLDTPIMLFKNETSPKVRALVEQSCLAFASVLISFIFEARREKTDLRH